MSFLTRHRTICAVLEEIKKTVDKKDFDPISLHELHELCDEAILYARRMSLKLTEYKVKELEKSEDQTGTSL